MNRGIGVSALLLGLAAVLVVALVMLGNWQLHRLEWKTALIDAVEARAFGAPVVAPRGQLDPRVHEYRRVAITGTFRHDHARLVKAVTELGPGFWVMTPLDDGARNVWINRGFVPSDRRTRGRYAEPSGIVKIIGLLRVTEPDGTLLQANDPAGGRWYSRDVAALSRDVEIESRANWFVDAILKERAAEPQWPRAGLTRLDFRNTHLAYALTWYAMAAALAVGIGYVVWLERRQRVWG